MKTVKLIEKEYVYYIVVDGEYITGAEKMNDLFAGRSWDMFEQTIETLTNLKRELGFDLQVERLPNSSEYIGKSNPNTGDDIFYHIGVE